MERYLEVMKLTAELSETCLEGIEHIPVQIERGLFEESMRLFVDVISAYSHIERSLLLIGRLLPMERIEDLNALIITSIEEIVDLYENLEWTKVLYIIRTRLIVIFVDWRNSIQTLVFPYILS
ncbi:hypothetical protein OB236_12505 [Paenibacillus sp. WQ 127069]|uniref:DUF8042 domain-containing protein n=1 Tax=Paenibacillus baimaensis TaxID=2982185 RepID=A0ABT2UFW7_9BACL|nr:hypothetical protein [Paenibacillus sp. WQ 127069]MCU6792941.1 hypothetical protein [Paenibacillus sp. WQ 127069]